MLAGSLEIRLFSDIARLQSDMNKANQTVDKAMGGIEKSVNLAKRAFLGLGASFSIAAIASTIDAYKRFDSQLKLATKTTQEYAEAYSNVVRIAKTSQSDIGAIGVLYARLTNNLRDFGTTQKEISTITEAVSLSLRVSNATVQETNSVMLQLSQSFGSGKINGQEFLAVSEGAPIIMRQLAKSLNKTYGELKNLSTQGKLTSEVLKTALSDPAYLASLREQAKAVGTISSALQVAKNAFTQYIGEADKGAGTSKLVSQGIILLAENINNLATVAIGAGIAAFGRFAAARLAGIAASNAENVATTASIALKQKLAAEELFLAERKLVAIKNELALKVAIAQSAAAESAAIAVKLSHSAIISKLDKAQTALASKQLALNTAMAASTAQTGLFSKAIAFLGGPIGLAIIAFGALAYAIDKAFDKEKVERYGKAIDGVRERAALLKEQAKNGISIDNNYAAELSNIKDLQKARDGLFAKMKADSQALIKPSLEKQTENALAYVQSLRDIKTAEKDLGLKIEQDNLNNTPKSNRALPDSIKLLSAQIKEQQDIINSANADLKAGFIIQSDYNRVVQDARKAIEDLNKVNKVDKDETAEKIRLLTIESKLIQDGVPEVVAKAAAQAKLNGATESQVIAIMNLTQKEFEREQGLKLANEQNKIAQELAKQYTEDLRDAAKAISDMVAAEDGISAKMQEEIDLLGKGSKYLTDMEVARLGDAAAAYEQNAATAIQIGLSKENIEYLKQQAQGLNELADAKANAEDVKLRLNSFKLDKEQSDNRIKEAERATKEMVEEAKKAGESIYKSISDSIVRSLESGKSSFKTFFNSLVNQAKATIIRIGVDFFMQGSGLKGLLSTVAGVLSSGGAGGYADERKPATGIFSGIKDAIGSGTDKIANIVGSLGQSLSNFGSTGTGIFKGIASKLGSFTQLNASIIGKAIPYIGLALTAFSVFKSVFGKKKVPRFSTLRAGDYADGVFTGRSNGQQYKPLGAEKQIDGLSEQFSKTLGGFLKGFGLSDSISTTASLFKKRKASYGNFAATFDGGSVSAGEQGKAKNVQQTFEKLVETVLGTTIVQAIQQSKAAEGIKALFNGLTDKTQVVNMINASLTLQEAQKELADKYGLTTDLAGKVSVASGEAGDALAVFVNSLSAVALSGRTVGAQLIKNRDTLVTDFNKVFSNSVTGSRNPQLPRTIADYDKLLKNIDKFAAAGQKMFAEVFALRDEFVAVTSAVDGLKGNVRGALFGLVSDVEKQGMLNEDLAKLFGSLNRAVPKSQQELIALGRSIDYGTQAGLDLAAVFPSLVSAFKSAQDGIDSLVNSLRDESGFKTLYDFNFYKGIASNYGAEFANRLNDGAAVTYGASNNTSANLPLNIAPNNNTTISTSDPNMLNAVATLTVTVNQLKSELISIKTNTKSSADTLLRVSPDGNSIQTKVAA